MNKTEMRNPSSMHIDKMSTADMLCVIQKANFRAVEAVNEQLKSIGEAVDAAAAAVQNGGRIIYIGCGTSGRLGVLDASECPPTFGVSPDTVVGIIAGGDRCLRSASEAQEDSGAAGVADLSALNPSEKDFVVGLSAAGGAAYVLEAINYAKNCGCVTAGVTSNENCPLADVADIVICADTGPEIITGSTRMKAGTAQKLVLNMISTCAMIKQGYVYENLMINLKPTNIKLKKRCIDIVTEITNLSGEEAERALINCNWDVRRTVEKHRINEAK